MDAWQYLALLTVRGIIEELRDEAVRPAGPIDSGRLPRRRRPRHGEGS